MVFQNHGIFYSSLPTGVQVKENRMLLTPSKRALKQVQVFMISKFYV